MIHHVFANKTNAGDWLAARAIQALLGPVPVLEHYCDTPFAEGALDGLAQADDHDLIVIGGGGLFMDYFAPFWLGFQTIASRVPYGFWGVGVCARKRAPSLLAREIIEPLVRQSRFCYVRDELTRQYLASCSLPGPVACAAILTPPEPVEDGRGLLHVDHYDNIGAEVFEEMVSIGQAFARATGRSYQRTNNSIRRGDEAALRATVAQYAGSDLVLSSRLHGCILALSQNKKVLAVSGDRKVESFMQMAGLSDWVIDLDNVKSLPRYLEVLDHQPAATKFVDQARRQNAAVAEQVRSCLAASEWRS